MSSKFSTRSMLAVAAVLLLVAAGLQDSRDVRFGVVPLFQAPEDAPAFAADHVLVKFTNTLAPEQIDQMVGRVGARWLESGEDRAFEVLQVPAGDVQRWVALLNG